MGADQSDPNITQYITSKLSNEINDYINGSIEKDSLRYKFFLMSANNYLKNEIFYQKIGIHQIADYINDLGIISIKEAKTIVHNIIQASNFEEVATFNLQVILPKMRIKFNEIYISPIYSNKLFNQIFSSSYKTKWGIYSPTSLVDWNSPDIEYNYRIQSQESLPQILQNLHQINYIVKIKNENQNETQTKFVSCPVLHSEDISYVVSVNYVEKLLDTNNINNDLKMPQGALPFKKKINKPTNWQPNIHIACFNGDEPSVLYCLQLLPILLNCPDNDGSTPAHKAAMGDRVNIIKLLYSLGADFTLTNNNGFLPHQMSGGKNTVLLFNSLGFNLNERNQNGESLLEIRTVNFNMDVIEAVIMSTAKILHPNPQGIYWMQFVIHGEYYKKEMNFVQFQKKIRKILFKKYKQDINKYVVFKEILTRNVNNCDQEDTLDINSCVTRKDVNRLKILLSLGAHADRIRDDGKTNLMLCAERNDHEIASILAKNFCDVNFKNNNGENTFWVASNLMNIETAKVLRDSGANINELSKSGNTILHVAYDSKRMDLFQFLLEIGCSPNIKNKDEETVLFQAFSAKDDSVAELLQDKYNGDINTKSYDNNTLAHAAVLEQDINRLDYYIKRGIDIEIKNNYGYSAFMISITMFDNLQLCSFLLSHGSNIDTQDLNGNTALLNILHSKTFNKNKFDFLIKNNCNFNIKNSMGEYPISVCIIHELKDEAQCLLDKGCIINDHKTEFEPLACALKIKSKYWFETLLEHGATATNVQYPILTNYISSNFFNFELLKKFEKMNVVFGGPIQTALRYHHNDVALYLWDNSNEQTRYEIAKTPDSFGMIPLSAAIVYDCPLLVNKLLCKDYEVMKPDQQNRTPFSYACQVNQTEWIDIIYSRITPENVNLVDNIGNSALTYLACNNNVQYCNTLFLNNVEIFNINQDHIGIIDAYQRLMNKYLELKQMALDNLKRAEEKCAFWNNRIVKLNDEIIYLRNIIFESKLFDHDPQDIGRRMANEYRLTAATREYHNAFQERDHAEQIREKYQERYVRIDSLTRKELISNFSLVVDLAKCDVVVANRRISVPEPKAQTDPTAFISGILCIIGHLLSH